MKRWRRGQEEPEKSEEPKDEGAGSPDWADLFTKALTKTSSSYHAGGFIPGAPPFTMKYRTTWGTGAPALPSGNQPTEPLPREESTIPVAGFRTWTLRRSYPTGYRLMSAHSQEVWEPNRRVEAVCKSALTNSMYITWPYSTPPKREQCKKAPTLGCMCGIYAYRDRIDLPLRLEPEEVLVCGEVALWGRVLVCERGYRGQYAYPQRLAVISGSNCLADSLELAYGVPCEVWE